MPAVPYKKYTLADEGKAWDGSAAEKRMRAWAGGESDMDWPKYRKGFGWYDGENSETFGAYKLPHHDIVNGDMVTVWNGVKAAGNACQGARNKPNIPDSDMSAVKSHLAKHYHEFGKKAPWEAQDEGDTSVAAEDKKPFWTMRKSIDGDTPEILFYGVISESSWWDDEISPKQFADALSLLGNVSSIKIRINSPGGDLFAGNAIYNILKNHPAKIISYVDGIAASAASIVLMAGDEIVMPRNGMIMIHNPSAMAVGDARDMRAMADMLDTARETMLAIYEARTGNERQKLIGLLNSETWLTAKDAVELGFADSIDEQMSIAASISDDKLIVNGLSFETDKFFKAGVPDILIKKQERKVTSKTPVISVHKDGDKTLYNLWCPFIENGVKEDKRMVYGYSTIFDVVDYDNQFMTREAIEDALPAYAEFAAIDVRHDGRIVGEAPVLQIDDVGLLTGAHIFEDEAWGKVEDGTYKGFSLGGEILAVQEKVIEGQLAEAIVKVNIGMISLCDRPKCPGAVYHLVSNQGGSLVLCIQKGGENKIMADEKKTEAEEQENKTLIAAFVDWIKGEGKDEVTAALGIDLSNYATKEDINGINNSVGEMKTSLADFIAKMEKSGEGGDGKSGDEAAAGAGDGKAAAEAQNAASDFTKVIESLGTTMASVATTLEDVVKRTAALEGSKGMRKSVDAVGGEGITDEKEKLWEGAVPSRKVS